MKSSRYTTGSRQVSLPGLVYSPMDKTHRQVRSAFTFVEIVISITLISLMSVVVMLAFSNTHRRSEQPRLLFSQVRQQNDILRMIADDLRWCDEIDNITTSRIKFTSPEYAGIVEYQWDNNADSLYRVVDGVKSLISDQVTVFSISEQSEKVGSRLNFYGIRLTLQIGADARQQVTHAIEFINTPYKDVGSRGNGGGNGGGNDEDDNDNEGDSDDEDD